MTVKQQPTGIELGASSLTLYVGSEEKLAKAVESGKYTEEELNAIRELARDAQFNWDFVFVENSEGAHNSALTTQCLNKAEALLNQAMALFKPQEG